MRALFSTFLIYTLLISSASLPQYALANENVEFNVEENEDQTRQSINQLEDEYNQDGESGTKSDSCKVAQVNRVGDQFVYKRDSTRNSAMLINLLLAGFAVVSSLIKLMPPNMCNLPAPSYYTYHAATVAQGLYTIGSKFINNKNTDSLEKEFKIKTQDQGGQVQTEIEVYEYAAKQTKAAYDAAKDVEKVNNFLALAKNVAIMSAAAESALMLPPFFLRFECGPKDVVNGVQAARAGSAIESAQNDGALADLKDGDVYKGHKVSIDNDGNITFRPRWGGSNSGSATLNGGVAGIESSGEVNISITNGATTTTEIGVVNDEGVIDHPMNQRTVSQRLISSSEQSGRDINTETLNRRIANFTRGPVTSGESYVAADGTLVESTVVVTGHRSGDILDPKGFDIGANAAMSTLQGVAASMGAQFLIRLIAKQIAKSLMENGLEFTAPGRLIWYTTQKILNQMLAGDSKDASGCLKQRYEEYDARAKLLRTTAGLEGTGDIDLGISGAESVSVENTEVVSDLLTLDDFKACTIVGDNTLKGDLNCSCATDPKVQCVPLSGFGPKKDPIDAIYSAAGVNLGSDYRTNRDFVRSGLSALSSGGTGRASLGDAGSLASKAFKIQKKTEDVIKSLNKRREKEGLPAIEVEKKAQQLANSLRRKTSLALQSAGVIDANGAFKGIPENFSPEQKQAIENAFEGESKNSNPGTVALKSDGNSKRKLSSNSELDLLDFSTSKGKESKKTKRSIASITKGLKMKEVDNLATKDKNIFEIISSRYIRSGYSRLLERKTPIK